MLVRSQGCDGNGDREGSAGSMPNKKEWQWIFVEAIAAFVAGLCVADAKAILVAELKLKQFLRFPWQARWSPGII